MFLVAILVLVVFTTNATNSTSSLESAKKLAIASNKLILVDFTASWCGPCKRMDRESWSNDEVAKIRENFIFLKIDIDYNKNISKKYGVKGIPYIFILDPNGEVIFSSIGYKTKSQIIKMLKGYSLNVEYVQSENLEFFKKATSFTSIKLAEKYLDFTLLFDDEMLKGKFRSLASKYLKISEKLVKKDKKNKSQIVQRTELLLVYSKLLKGKYDKVVKKLDDKFNESDIVPQNNSLYNFLYFTSYKKLADKVNAKKRYEKLRLNSDYLDYLQKHQKI